MDVFNHVISGRIDLVNQPETFARKQKNILSTNMMPLFVCLFFGQYGRHDVKGKSLCSNEDLLLQNDVTKFVDLNSILFFLDQPSESVASKIPANEPSRRWKGEALS